MEELVKKFHKAQFRNKNKVPYIEHLIGVRSILQSVLAITGECTDPAELKILEDAALGHDLIEDTDVKKEEIIAVGNEKTLALIEKLSNPVDDYHLDNYMRQIRESEEEVRIIKYADLVENTASVSYGLHDLGINWFYDFYEPILKSSTENLANTEFVRYAKTANLLRSMLKVATKLTYDKILLLQEESNGKSQ